MLLKWLALVVLLSTGPMAAAQTKLTCASEQNRPNYCPADTRAGVRLTKQLSDAACREGDTWGYDYRGIWVDRGCRAEFEIGRGGYQPQAQFVTCASQDNRRQFCPADTRGGVRLVRRISDAECREGVTWDYDSRGIWVDRGCRAEFEVGAGGYSPSGPAWGSNRPETIACASERNRPNFCPANTRGGVRLIRQVSDAACREGETWGYDRRGIWVDHGCRAEFEVRPGWGRGRPEIITCSSENRRRQFCPADTRSGERLVRRISDAECREGTSWGYDRGGIWVDRGCRAEFEVNSGDWGWDRIETGPAQKITCESFDRKRKVCPVEIRGGVRVGRQLSDTECREGQTWGYDSRGVWVDRGCRAEFEILSRRAQSAGESLGSVLQACAREVSTRFRAGASGTIDLEDATQGGVSTYLIEWRAPDGSTGYCRVNRNNQVVQVRKD